MGAIFFDKNGFDSEATIKRERGHLDQSYEYALEDYYDEEIEAWTYLN